MVNLFAQAWHRQTPPLDLSKVVLAFEIHRLEVAKIINRGPKRSSFRPFFVTFL
jgi:hypothetical protein